MSMRNLFDMAQAVSTRSIGQHACLQEFLVIDWGGSTDVERASAIQAAFALTPRIMEWGSGFWLLDLSSCLKYWSAQAAWQKVEPLQIITAQLEAVALGSEIKSWRGAIAAHPWQALLLAQHMRERKIAGVLSVDAPLGQTLLRELSWQSWRLCVEGLAAHRWALGAVKGFIDKKTICQEARDKITRINTTRKEQRSSSIYHTNKSVHKTNEPAVVRKQLNQMERTVKRMGLRTPWSLREIPTDQLQRRFGALVRDAYHWAYGSRDTAAIWDSGFPWQSLVVEDKPQVVTHLDEPLCEWDHIQVLLCQDLDRLCELACWQAGERVVSLEWRLVFRDFSQLAVPIRFRHPHPLHLEKGVHATALLQALYAFQSTVPHQTLEDGHGQIFAAEAFVVPIISWTLIIDERLQIPAKGRALFDDGVGGNTQALLQLENRLKIPLQAYALRSDWLPEDSFCTLDQIREAPMPSESIPSLCEIARRRPLFIYEKPQNFAQEDSAVRWDFCERTAAKWWHLTNKSSDQIAQTIMQRDYYRLTDRQQRSYWVYRDTQSQCYVHGVYA